jgi:hypothetical protein
MKHTSAALTLTAPPDALRHSPETLWSGAKSGRGEQMPPGIVSRVSNELLVATAQHGEMRSAP